MKHLPLLTAHQTPPGRAETDRLELLTALINGPSFDPLFRTELIDIPRGHAVYAWECVVSGCEQFRGNSGDLCSAHQRQWKLAREAGTGKASILLNADQLAPADATGQRVCRICLDRPATDITRRLCGRHKHSWFYRVKTCGEAADYDDWPSEQQPHPGFGRCCVVVCGDFAQSSLGPCAGHESRHRSAGRPGGAHLLGRKGNQFSGVDDHRVVVYAEELTFRRWCAQAYFGPEDTRDAGFIETDHFGVRFPNCSSCIDLTVVSQRWLRNMLWDQLAAAMRSPHCLALPGCSPTSGAPAPN